MSHAPTGLSGSTGVSAPAATEFQEAKREIAGLTAGVERRALAWLVARLPGWVSPDQLTLLGLAAMLLGGVLYAASGRHPWLLLLVNAALVLNWFGDSLDGTLARHRQKQRPRYGFYVDHLVDAFGVLFLLGGLALSGLMSPGVAAALLVVYYLFSINMYLATYALGRFKISFGPVGGTELRMLLALANVAVLLRPRVGLGDGSALLFDVLGAGAAVALAFTLLRSVVQLTLELYRLERIQSG